MRRISAMTALTAAVAIAVALYVLPWSPGSKTAAVSSRAQQAPTGIPLPSALASVTTSGATPSCSKPNQRPVRAIPVWISSTIIKRSALVAHPTNRGEIAGRCRVHAALTEDRLDEDGGDRAIDRRGERVGIAPGDVSEALRHRVKRFVLGRLPGRRQGGESPTVKASEGADDRVTAASTVLAGELDRTLDRLGAAVGEEHPSVVANGFAHQLVDGDGSRDRLRIGEVVADVQQLAGLRRDCRRHRRVGVTQ